MRWLDESEAQVMALCFGNTHNTEYRFTALGQATTRLIRRGLLIVENSEGYNDVFPSPIAVLITRALKMPTVNP